MASSKDCVEQEFGVFSFIFSRILLFMLVEERKCWREGSIRNSIIVIDIIYHKGLIEFVILKGEGVGKYENISLKGLGPQLAEISVFTSAFGYLGVFFF